MDYKRKLLELEAQSPWSILESLKQYRKKWKKGSLVGSGALLKFTVLGGKAGFECFLSGEAFDEHIRPAIEKALKHSLEMQLMYIDMQKGAINAEIGEKE